MKYYFITGVSSGIGEALVNTLLQGSDEINIRGCARRKSPIEDERFRFYETDLSVLDTHESFVQDFFKDIPSNVTSLVLINNAGMLGRIGFTGTQASHHYEEILSVNLIAPMVLSEAFARAFQALPLQKIIFNISSGAAHKDYAGWAAYCASKAGLDRFSNVMKVEQKTQAFPIEVLSYAPGVVDTAMQAEIREATPSDFPSLPRFVSLYEEGSLLNPDKVAQDLLQWLNGAELRS